MLSFFPLDVLDETVDLIESVSEGFPTCSCIKSSDNMVRLYSHIIRKAIRLYKGDSNSVIMLFKEK